MLRIYPVSLQVLREIRPLIEQIERFDRDQARQLRRSATSIALNIAEGDGGRAGTQRSRFLDALGSARESLANLDVAEVMGYISPIDPGLRDRFGRVIATLIKLVH